MKTALTIAGSDSSGGAGVQADLKTFSAFGVFGTSAITAVTAQNTQEVRAIHPVPPEVVEAQVGSVLEDIGAHAVKTGMLFSSEIILAVSRVLSRHRPAHLVVDPVMISKSGTELLQPAARSAMVSTLFPLCEILTPNVPEAEVILGTRLRGPRDLKEAAKALRRMGPRFVVLKGGHREGDAVDLFFDGRTFEEVGGNRIETRNTHGTGCTLSAALAACLARGADPLEALIRSKAYVTRAILHAPGLGSGSGPLKHGVESGFPEGDHDT